MTPSTIAADLEEGVPTVAKRLEALRRVADRGWVVGLRFDPLILCDEFERHYRELFESALEVISPERLHSVTIGPFRLPKPFYRNLRRKYPREPLFAGPLEESGGIVSYRTELERELMEFCHTELARHLPAKKIFSHAVFED